MASILDEARLKLSRGKEHLKTLDDEMRRFHTLDTIALVYEYDPERAKYVCRFKIVQPIPQHSWGLILGDSVHNVRSALDYIAWRLAGSVPTDLRTLFPICISPAKFHSQRYRFARLHPDAIAEIESMQPYKRPDPIHSSLWLIEELDARDKHKLITTTQAITRVQEFRGKGQVLIPYDAIEKPIEHNSILVEFDTIPDENVEVEFDFATYIIFERGIVGETRNTYGVIRCLEEAYADIAKVIDYFDELITLNPHLIPS